MKTNKRNRPSKFIQFLPLIIAALGLTIALIWTICYINKPKEYIPETRITYNNYSLNEEFFNQLLESCETYNTDLDLVIAIMDYRTGIRLNFDNNYGKGPMAMRSSTEEWIKDKTNTNASYIHNPKTAAITSVYLVHYYIEKMDNIDDTIIAICGNETDTVIAIKDIYLANTGKELK